MQENIINTLKHDRRASHSYDAAHSWFSALGYTDQEIKKAWRWAEREHLYRNMQEIFSRHGYKAPTVGSLMLDRLEVKI